MRDVERVTDEIACLFYGRIEFPTPGPMDDLLATRSYWAAAEFFYTTAVDRETIPYIDDYIAYLSRI